MKNRRVWEELQQCPFEKITNLETKNVCRCSFIWLRNCAHAFKSMQVSGEQRRVAYASRALTSTFRTKIYMGLQEVISHWCYSWALTIWMNIPLECNISIIIWLKYTVSHVSGKELTVTDTPSQAPTRITTRQTNTGSRNLCTSNSTKPPSLRELSTRDQEQTSRGQSV